MYDLGNFYYYSEKKYDKAKQYYSLACDKGHANATYRLGYYYHIEKNYNKAKKYYSIAIEKGNTDALVGLANYYYNIVKNYCDAKKYYLMSIKNGTCDAVKDIGVNKQIIENDNLNIVTESSIIFKGENNDAINNLAKCYYVEKKI